jgi:hypothetical protein
VKREGGGCSYYTTRENNKGRVGGERHGSWNKYCQQTVKWGNSLSKLLAINAKFEGYKNKINYAEEH